MGTIRRVPEPYPTIESAVSAAVVGDAVVIAAGVYELATSAPIVVNKRVHLVAEGSAASETVIRRLSSADMPILSLAFASPPGEVTLIEGITLHGHNSTLGVENLILGGGELWLNRVSAARTNSAGEPGAANHLHGIVGRQSCSESKEATRARLTHCAGSSLVGKNFYPGDTVEVIATILPYAGTFLYVTNHCAGRGPPLRPVYDWVAAPAEGYGPGYGESLAPQFQGLAYRLAGSEILAAPDSPADAQILLYRETAYQSGRMEAFRWMETAPDPITGEWEFRYLPTLDSAGNPQRYAVAINPPECYGGELLRWYPPQQGES
jgi:hypothetical protein